jgi:hypothetical protein
MASAQQNYWQYLGLNVSYLESAGTKNSNARMGRKLGAFSVERGPWKKE